MAEREIKIEDYLKDRAEALGGLCWKLAPVSCVGLPDRLVLLPGGKIGFLELKRPGRFPTAAQRHWMRELHARGFAAGWTDDRDGVDEFLAELNA